METIVVTINGEQREIPAGLTVEGLLEHLKLKQTTAIVEHNLVILKIREHDAAEVREGDKFEIVRFVGGG